MNVKGLNITSKSNRKQTNVGLKLQQNPYSFYSHVFDLRVKYTWFLTWSWHLSGVCLGWEPAEGPATGPGVSLITVSWVWLVIFFFSLSSAISFRTLSWSFINGKRSMWEKFKWQGHKNPEHHSERKYNPKTASRLERFNFHRIKLYYSVNKKMTQSPFQFIQ